MFNDHFVIDTIVHAFNLSEDNFARDHTTQIAEGIFGVQELAPPQYRLPRAAYMRDWDMADTVNVLFAESDTDVAVYHPTPIFAFKDGLSAWEKAAGAIERWPNRIIASYACVDPLAGRGAIELLDRQMELFKPLGLKLYPTSWRNDTVEGWRMDDPRVAFPLYEAAAERGIKTVAIHKALPLGPVPTGPFFHPADVEGAAAAFPELNFEIVHGGAAFAEETAWLIARFENIYVNLEFLPMLLPLRPELFARCLLGLMHIGGEPILDRLFYSSGAMQYHPQVELEAFGAFQFPDDMRSEYGLFGQAPPQLTEEHKRKILGGNYAKLHGLDIDALRRNIEGDEFARGPGDALAAPWSTTSIAHLAPGASAPSAPAVA
jgi:predicted TIM-barrel fold metal-dependent hydrolase